MFDQDSLAFYDLYLDNQGEIKSKIITPTIFFPLIFPEVPQALAEKIIIKHLFNREEFNMPFPMPSVAKDEPSFSPLETLFLWRGPTWVYHNWFLYKCLCFRGYKKEAQILAQTIKRLIEKSGFREYYNPFTGEGYGAKGFTWSGLVLDMR